MHEYLYGREAELVAWAEARIPHQRFRPDAVTIGHAIHGKIAGVAVFDTFATNDCLVGLASDGSRRWMTFEFAVRVFAFPFLQLGYSRISCVVSTQNAPSLAFTRKMGWTEEGRLREAGHGGEDLLLFGMLRRECRWLRRRRPTSAGVAASSGL